MFAAPFAVFVLCRLPCGNYAATTRAADRGESGRIGLPGGKVDPGETAIAAAIRESAEEGWDVFELDSNPIHSAIVDGKPVQWFRAKKATKKNQFKEKGRILPVEATEKEIRNSGFGNENLPF